MKQRHVHAPGVVAGALSLLLAGCSGHQAETPVPRVGDANDQVARGRYLALAADCVACHTAPGGREYAGGRAFRLAMGTLYSPNITPDRATGIGGWDDEQFLRALRQGVGPDGRHYYPAFPYNYYTQMSREDALAIRAYLHSLPAVNAPTPAAQLRFPYNQRGLMAVWNLLYFRDQRFAPDPAASVQVQRGAYLAEALGHCGVCHTPTGLLQGPRRSAALSGAVIGGWHAWNITSSREYGIGGWSTAQLADYLGSGHAPGRGSAAGPMAEVVGYSLQHLARADQEALAAYLKSIPAQEGDGVPVAGGVRQAANAHPGDPGALLYAGNCAGCHGDDGQGVMPRASFAGVHALQDRQDTNLVQVVLHGAQPVGNAPGMPGFGAGFTDSEVRDLVNYTAARFGAGGGVDALQVGRLRAASQ